MLGFPLLYFKGMRLMMFQLSSFYCMFIVWTEIHVLFSQKMCIYSLYVYMLVLRGT